MMVIPIGAFIASICVSALMGILIAALIHAGGDRR